MYEKISLSKFQRPGNARNKSCTRALSVPSESEGCKKLACKCGWQGGGFLNMQPWFGAEHLRDTVYRLTSKSTHTHSESIVKKSAPCPPNVAVLSEAASGTNLPAAPFPLVQQLSPMLYSFTQTDKEVLQISSKPPLYACVISPFMQ